MVIRYDIAADAFVQQDLDHIAITESEIATLTCAFRRIGFWRCDIRNGFVYWSSGLFEIFGLEPTTGPINLSEANALIHPEDIEPLYAVFEQACLEQTAFHYILRLKRKSDEYGFVRSVGQFRTTADGRPELVGMFYEFFEQMRTVALAAKPA